jgi:hypothetical protein
LSQREALLYAAQLVSSLDPGSEPEDGPHARRLLQRVLNGRRVACEAYRRRDRQRRGLSVPRSGTLVRRC